MSTATVTAGQPTRQVACAHCGLPTPIAAGQEDAGPQFCCRGCQGAYDLIRGWGLQAFYELRDAPGEEIGDEARMSFDDLDDPRLLGRSAPLAIDSPSDKPLLKSTLAISGLHCAACSWLIESASSRIPGWQSALVNMHRCQVEVVFNPTEIRLSEIARYLARIGYEVFPLSDGDDAADQIDQGRRLLVDVAVAGFCAANAMWIAVALYAGQFAGIAESHAVFLRWAGVALGAAAVIFPGRVFFRSALASIRSATPHMDLPVAVGLTAGLLASLYALFDPSREVYFDSIACLVFFLLTGRWLQTRGQRRAGEAVSQLMRISPEVAARIDETGTARRVSVDELAVGDLVRVDASESVPIDGVIVDGQTRVDRSLLTGESCPVAVGVGDQVEAGTDNTQSPMTIRVTVTSDQTRLAEIQRSVADAAASRTPIVQLANRIGAWFVVVVLALALVTAWIWWQFDASRLVPNVVALLIVACPCALALATPLAIAVSIGRLANRNVLVRSGDCLERLGKPGTIFFDKTGTLTQGRMRVSSWHGSDDVLRDVAAIESQVNHPVARAIVDFAGRRPTALLEARNVEHCLGRGVTGSVARHSYQIGSLRLLDGRPAVEPVMERKIESITASGASPIVVIRDDQLVGLFGVVDPLREQARDVIDALRTAGWHVELLSGDHPASVIQAAVALGVSSEDVRGGLLPDEKLAAISEAAGRGPVLMVGDGVNDAAALAAADVGIAVRGGARASLAAAPVVLSDGKLHGTMDLISMAAQTGRTIRRNFGISIGYNVVAVVMAMLGWITPLVAAALMPISSLTVLALTFATVQLPQPADELGTDG